VSDLSFENDPRGLFIIFILNEMTGIKFNYCLLVAENFGLIGEALWMKISNIDSNQF